MVTMERSHAKQPDVMRIQGWLPIFKNKKEIKLEYTTECGYCKKEIEESKSYELLAIDPYYGKHSHGFFCNEDCADEYASDRYDQYMEDAFHDYHSA